MIDILEYDNFKTIQSKIQESYASKQLILNLRFFNTFAKFLIFSII